MNMIWRMLWVILFGRYDSPINTFDTATTYFRVMPTDVDVLMHLNNGRYFSFMDLARLHFYHQIRWYYPVNAKGYNPVVASEMIRFKSPINLFQRFAITTQIMGWDDKFLYIVHHFKNKKNKVCALSIVKVCFIHRKNGRGHMHDILKIMNITSHSPTLPLWVKNWQLADKHFYDETIVNNEQEKGV